MADGDVHVCRVLSISRLRSAQGGGLAKWRRSGLLALFSNIRIFSRLLVFSSVRKASARTF
eukprot:1561562-Prymnesium_polylepis.1